MNKNTGRYTAQVIARHDGIVLTLRIFRNMDNWCMISGVTVTIEEFHNLTDDNIWDYINQELVNRNPA